MKKIIVSLLMALATTAWAKQEPSIVLYNVTTQRSVITQNNEIVRPMASMTKLMTAMVALDTGFALERKVPIIRCCGGILPKKEYTRLELFNAMLVRSDNSAAETLALDYPGGRAEFIAEMNHMARRLGMVNTHFEDASGLSANNVSTAADVQRMITAALAYDFIRNTSTQKKIDLEILGKRKTTHLILNNTNSPLLGSIDNVILSKTGLTSKAGFCLSLALEDKGNRYIVVVMGAGSKKERTRIVEDLVRNHVR